MKRVVITGLGCLTPIGATVPEFRDSLFEGRTGIGPIGLLPEAIDGSNGIRFSQMAAIADFGIQTSTSPPASSSPRTNPTAQYAIVAARQAAV